MILFVVAAASALSPPEGAAPGPDDSILYVVRAGDTLERLARAYLLPGRQWRALQRRTKVSDPRRLPINRTLSIPRAWLRYKVEPARLASHRGSVSISAGGRPVALAPGISVGEGAEIATGANSFVTLMLADRSKVVIPSQSRVRLRELRRILLTGAIDYRIDVEGGRLETKVSPLKDPTGRYRINTPISMTAVRGTEFRIRFAGDAAAASTEVLEGTVAVSSSSGQHAQTVEQGFGATASKDETRITGLLPAPRLVDPGKLQAGEAAEFRTAPAPGAAAYRLVIAADAGFVENLAEQSSQSGIFSLPDIPNGNLFARVSAFSADGLEGLSQSYSFRRRLASIHADAAQTDEGFRFRWSGAGDGRRRYRFQLFRGSTEGRPAIDEVGLTLQALTLRELPAGVYYWRVGLAQNANGEDVENWTEFEKLTVSSPSTRRR